MLLHESDPYFVDFLLDVLVQTCEVFENLVELFVHQFDLLSRLVVVVVHLEIFVSTQKIFCHVFELFDAHYELFAVYFWFIFDISIFIFSTNFKLTTFVLNFDH